MQWVQVFTIIISVVSLMLWIRKDSRDDMRHFERRIDLWKEDLGREFRGWRHHVEKEFNSFHIRLSILEDKINTHFRGITKKEEQDDS